MHPLSGRHLEASAGNRNHHGDKGHGFSMVWSKGGRMPCPDGSRDSRTKLDLGDRGRSRMAPTIGGRYWVLPRDPSIKGFVSGFVVHSIVRERLERPRDVLGVAAFEKNRQEAVVMPAALVQLLNNEMSFPAGAQPG